MREYRIGINVIPALVLGMAVLAFCSGCGGGGGGGTDVLAPDDGTGGTTDVTPPAVVSTSVNPSSLTSAGGSVTISAQATDNAGIRGVTAVVTKPDGSTATVTLSGSGTYTGTYAAAANTSRVNEEYSVRVQATDTSDNAAFGQPVPFLVLCENSPEPVDNPLDATPPTVVSTSVTPSSLTSTGGSSTISASVTDNEGIYTVVATITKPDGSTASVILSGSGTYTGTYVAAANTSQADVTYSVRVEATDTSGNKSFGQTETFLVACPVVTPPPEDTPDTTPPTVVSTTLTPTSLTCLGGSATISAAVTDNEGIYSVVATITKPDGSTATVILSGSGTYTGTYVAAANTSQADVTYSVRVEATDTSGNKSFGQTETFLVACPVVTPPPEDTPDTTPPTVVSTTLTPTSLTCLGGSATISAAVTDNEGIYSVVATITKPDGSTATVMLTGSGTYTGTYVAAANTSQVDASYSVRVEATDTSGNKSFGQTETFLVACPVVTPPPEDTPDTTPPTIVSTSFDPYYLTFLGGNITILAQVTDNAGIFGVVATVTKPDGSSSTVLLTGTGTYSGTYWVAANGTRSNLTYSVRVEATDTSGNKSVGTAATFAVVCADSPPPPPPLK